MKPTSRQITKKLIPFRKVLLDPGKKRDYSKKRSLTKAERQRLSERLHGTDTKLLWHQIRKLSESTVSESTSDSESMKGSSSLDSHVHIGVVSF